MRLVYTTDWISWRLKAREVWIKLKKDWNSYWRGSIIEVEDEEGVELIRRRIAIYSSSEKYMTERDVVFALKRR